MSDQVGRGRPVRWCHHGCGGARQAVLSPIGFVDCLPATRKTTKTDRDNCMALVVDDPRLEQEDRRRLLTTITAGPRARQDGQKWSPEILNIFTSTD